MLATIGNNLLRKLKPKNKPYDVRDDKLVGFIVRVNITGKLVFMCEYARGKRVTLGKAGVLTPAQARDMAKEVLADATKGIDPRAAKKAVNKHLTLREYILKEYEPWIKGIRKTGKKLVSNNLMPFVQLYGEKLLTDLDIFIIEKWRTKRIDMGVKPATVNKNIGILKASLSKAVEWKFIDINPIQKLKPLKVDPIARIKFLNRDEDLRLKRAIDEREERIKQERNQANLWRQKRDHEKLTDLRKLHFVDHLKPMIVVARNTGIRKNELFSIDKEKDLNLDLRILSVTDTNAKSKKTRHIPLNEEAFDVIKKWIEQTGPSGLLFSNKNGEKFVDIKSAWTNLLVNAAIGKDLRWHDLRHDFASRLVMAGVDLNTVRELLGHSDIKMTLRYAHLAPKHKAEAVARLVSAAASQ